MAKPKRSNSFVICDKITECYDSQGRMFIIDTELLEVIQPYYWSVTKDGYVVRPRGKILLHRFLTDCPEGMIVEHLNGKNYDNRYSNLRVCTYKERYEK